MFFCLDLYILCMKQFGIWDEFGSVLYLSPRRGCCCFVVDRVAKTGGE